MTTLNLLGVAAYSGIAALCLAAAWGVRTSHRPPRHGAIWLGFALNFVLLALARTFAIERRIEASIRQHVMVVLDYENRALIQVPLVVATLVIGAVFSLLAYRWWRRRTPDRQSRPIYFAALAVGGFLFLQAVRVISWHESDRLLYTGRVHLNWLLEAFLCLIVTGSAVAYLRSSPPARHTRPRRSRKHRGGPGTH